MWEWIVVPEADAGELKSASSEEVNSQTLSSHLRAAADRLRAHEPALSERYFWLEAMANHVPDYMYAKDLEGRFLFANQAVVRGNGFDKLEDMVGLTEFDLFDHDAASAISAIENRVMATGEADLGYEERALRGGPDRWLMISRVPLRDQVGNIIGVVGASRDISARKASERLVEAQTKILELIVAAVAIPRLLTDLAALLEGAAVDARAAVLLKAPSGHELYVAAAPSFETLAGRHIPFEPDESLGVQAERIAADFLDSRKFFRCVEIPSSSGECHGFLAISLPVEQPYTGFGEFVVGVARMAGIAIDRSLAEERIRFLAQHDSLTELPNRSLLDQKLEEILAWAEASSQSVAVGFLDLDNFKLVNDSLGHSAGDMLLKIIAGRIVAAAGEHGLVARIGGDEFILVLQGTEADFGERLRAVRELVAQPLTIADIEMRMTCSMGMACFPQHGRTASQLFANADTAMYRVKENGRDGFEVFSDEMAEKANRKLLRSEELRRALQRDEFVLHFQPQKNLKTGTISGIEALVRWQHPREGLVSPDGFIPLAEETGLIVELGAAVLHKACAQARAWQDEGLPPVRMGVNVSARQFQEAGMTAQVAAALADSGLDPQWLEIEITESLIMRDVKASVTKMVELTELGVSLALDDFGTGYSSLSTLKSFPLSRLKIDRSFIADIPKDEDDMAITAAIVSLAQKLGLEVLAEGVETEEQASFLQSAGCQNIQGYLFSRAVPAKDIAALFG